MCVFFQTSLALNKLYKAGLPVMGPFKDLSGSKQASNFDLVEAGIEPEAPVDNLQYRIRAIQLV